MDLKAICQKYGVDKRPEDLRPRDARWCNNAVQVQLPDGKWGFWEWAPQWLDGETPSEDADPGAVYVAEKDFADGKEYVKTLSVIFPKLKFRLVGIVEVK